MPTSALSVIVNPIANPMRVVLQQPRAAANAAAAPAAPPAVNPPANPSCVAKTWAVIDEYCTFPNHDGYSGVVLAFSAPVTGFLTGWAVAAVPTCVAFHYLGGYSGAALCSMGMLSCAGGFIPLASTNPTIKIIANQCGCGDKI